MLKLPRARYRSALPLSLALVLSPAAWSAGAAAPPTSAAPATRSTPATPAVVTLERVLAVVNDEAITRFDLDDARRAVLSQLEQQKVAPPAPDVLDKQLLEKIMTQRALLQYAKESGIRADDTQVERAIGRVAQENKLSTEDFRKVLARENIPYAKYREDIRTEIIMQRLREREVDTRITVSDAEVDSYLATLKLQSGGEAEYRVAHILVAVPEQATAPQIEARRQRAEEALRGVKSGGDFSQLAASFSDAPDALSGGNLGWRPGARLPTVFAEPVRGMKAGEVSPILRSAAGFHIVKLLEKRAVDAPHVVDQTHVRHILVRVNENTSESDARAKIDRLKDRIDTGTKFEDLAKISSEDASAAKGGDLGWVNPGDTVPEFEEAMSKVQIGGVLGPIRTPFGWHLIQVLERRNQDVTTERQRQQAQIAIRQRKSDEGFEDWARQIRDRAYVEVRLDER